MPASDTGFLSPNASIIASVLGLSALLHVSALAFQAVKFAGVLYLFYLAWSMWRQTGSLTLGSPSSGKNLWQIAIKGLLINILNPKLTVFFLTFLPLFVSPQSSSPLGEMSLLALLFMAMTLGIFLLYGISANLVSRHVANSPKVLLWLRRSFGATFALLGIKLAMTEQ